MLPPSPASVPDPICPPVAVPSRSEPEESNGLVVPLVEPDEPPPPSDVESVPAARLVVVVADSSGELRLGVERVGVVTFGVVTVDVPMLGVFTFGVVTVGVRTVGVVGVVGVVTFVVGVWGTLVDGRLVPVGTDVEGRLTGVGPVGPVGNVSATASLPNRQTASVDAVTTRHERVRLRCEITLQTSMLRCQNSP
jgi:hypothetical protein